MTLFSVITVTKNNLHGLQKTFESLENQSCTDYEWIVQDGASTDGSAAFLDTTFAQYESTPDNGLYEAMNTAMIRAGGTYLVFMNAGDLFADAHVLDHVQNALIHAKPDVIYGDSIEDGHYKTARSYLKIWQGLITHHQSIFYKRSLIMPSLRTPGPDGSEAIQGNFSGLPRRAKSPPRNDRKPLRYNTDYRIAADYDFTLNALLTSRETGSLNFPICHFETGGLSQQNAWQGRVEQFQIRKAHRYHPAKNILIFTAQTALYAFRKITPGLYWRLKGRR